MIERFLPTIDEVLCAMSERPLGMGEEATVYKVHTNPKFTVRVSRDAPSLEILAQRIFDEKFTVQKDIFEGRNYGQTVAYMWLDERDEHMALIAICRYAPGVSIEIWKPGQYEPSSEEALMKTIVFSKTILNLPDKAYDGVCDDTLFLSSKGYSIDTGNCGWFSNMGNILLDAANKRLQVVDIQPFYRQHPGINMNHTKGFNTPLYLAHGLITGSYKHAKEHSKYPALIEYRTETIDKIISAAERNHINDLGGYIGNDLSKIEHIWDYQLSLLNIEEKYRKNFVKRVCSIKDEQRYPVTNNFERLVRVAGRSMYT